MGYRVIPTMRVFELRGPNGEFGGRYVSEDNAYLHAPDYCTDPAASLEVQAAAIEANFEGYVYNLNEIKYRGYEAMTFKVISEMLTATPGERAMAAWMTLKADTASGSA
ncbi:hypothetical protein D3C71_1898180 [compost metagenome]